MIEWIKTHKVWVIGGAVALLLLYLVSRGSGSSASSGGSSTDVAAATAMQNAQLQANAQGQQVSAAAQAQSEQTAAQLELGKLSIAQAGAHDQLAATVATSNINANQQLQSLLGTLSANVANNASNNDVAKTTVLATNATQQQQIFANMTISNQQTLANALTHQSDNQTAVALGGYNAAVQIQQGNQSAAVAINASHDEHTGGLFGGGGFLGLGF